MKNTEAAVTRLHSLLIIIIIFKKGNPEEEEMNLLNICKTSTAAQTSAEMQCVVLWILDIDFYLFNRPGLELRTITDLSAGAFILWLRL